MSKHKKVFISCICVLIMVSIIGSVFAISSMFRLRVTSGSMIPTIQVNEQLLVKKVKSSSDISTGDIIVFIKDNELLVKRLIGLPGDIVEIRGGLVFVNGEQLIEGYVQSIDDTDCTFYLSEDQYFVLGDNRSNSYDSRYWDNPYVHFSDIKGKIIAHLYPKLRVGVN